MKYFTALFTLVALHGCSDRTESQSSPKAIATISVPEEKLTEVVNIDYENGQVQRLFIVLTFDELMDENIFGQIVCDLEQQFPLDSNSNISVFTHSKYANYKTEIFPNIGEGLSNEEYEQYQNWVNEFYIGEFELETRTLSTYPASKTHQKGEYRVERCT